MCHASIEQGGVADWDTLREAKVLPGLGRWHEQHPDGERFIAGDAFRLQERHLSRAQQAMEAEQHCESGPTLISSLKPFRQRQGKMRQERRGTGGQFMFAPGAQEAPTERKIGPYGSRNVSDGFIYSIYSF